MQKESFADDKEHCLLALQIRAHGALKRERQTLKTLLPDIGCRLKVGGRDTSRFLILLSIGRGQAVL